MLARSVYLSLDPYMRGRMNDAESYARPLAIGEVMTGGAVGFVVESNHPSFRAGDVVEGMLGWQEYAVVPGQALRRIDPEHRTDLDRSRRAGHAGADGVLRPARHL